MALRASPKAGRKKVRCPKCTAHFSEPAKAVFECPICSCQLSANGAIASTESPTKDGDYGQRKAVIGSDEPIMMQSPMDFVKKEQRFSNGNDMPQGDSVGAHSPLHGASEPGNFKSRKEREESLLRLVACAKEQAALVITAGQNSSDDASKEKPLMVREETNLIAAGDEGIEKEVMSNGVSSNRRLKSQLLRTTRCEFSFKYALRGASPLESDSELLHRKIPPYNKIVSSEASMPDTEASDMPLHMPLRVRISKAHEESSDQSEHGRRSSFGCETDSDDGSGSDFDFPAPWAEGLQDIVLPASFGQNDAVLPDSTTNVSAGPHQLELQDVYDTFDHETIERESELRDEESSHGRVQLNEENHVFLGPAHSAEATISESTTLSSHTQSLDVSDLASHIGSVMLNDNLDVVGNNAAPFMEGGTLKLGGSGLEECSDGEEEQEAVVRQVLKMNGQCNGKQESIYAEKEEPKSSPDSTNLATLPSHVYRTPKASASNVDHMENAEVEQDLYKFPLEVYGNDSFSGESSHSTLRTEEETTAPSLSDGTFVNTRLHHEKKNPHKSSHGKFYGNLGSRLIRSDNGEDSSMSGQERSLRGLASLRETSSQATSEHVDWEGHIMAAEERNGHPDLHEMEGKLGSCSQYPVNNALGFSVANPQPYAVTNHHYGFGASGTTQICPYQLPSQSLMHPAAYQNHGLSHCGYHAISPACMLCSYQYHQHPHMQPQHTPPHCGVCFSQSGSIAYNPGLVEHWNCHQAHHGPGSSCAGSLVDYPQASSTNLIQKHDFPNAESRSQASSSARKATQYPPFPKNGAAPYVTCKGCSRVLQVPSDLPPNRGAIQKLRCGACGKVTKFFVNGYDRQRHLVSSTLPPELDAMGGVTNMLPLVQYGTRSRQVPASSPPTSIESSYQHGMLKGSPVPHWSNQVSPQANDITTLRTSEQNAQGRESFGVQPRNRVMDASHNTYGQHDPSISVTIVSSPSHAQNDGIMSPRNATLRSTESFGFERSKVNPAHLTVDEKEEGLDFGAPRISDGDSLDHSESRRSPESHQAFHEATHISQGTPSRGHPPSEQVYEWGEDHGTAAQERRPGSPLLVLLNQESTRFRLKLEPRVSFEGTGSAISSPASDSSLYTHSLHDHPQKGEQGNPRSPGQHFVSKGPKYIAGLLRRSLRDFGRGGQ